MNSKENKYFRNIANNDYLMSSGKIFKTSKLPSEHIKPKTQNKKQTAYQKNGQIFFSSNFEQKLGQVNFNNENNVHYYDKTESVKDNFNEYSNPFLEMEDYENLDYFGSIENDGSKNVNSINEKSDLFDEPVNEQITLEIKEEFQMHENEQQENQELMQQENQELMQQENQELMQQENQELIMNMPKSKNKKSNEIIPNMIFIIPYRDREEHKHFFDYYMQHILEDYEESSYKIYYIHQKDNRPFNRGAVKNMGFLIMKELYPDDYNNISFIFHDIDTIPYKKNLIHYETNFSEIKHFYGFNDALGGIVSIKGVDFEKTNGYVNNWGWGFEDNSFYRRAVANRIFINRETFFPIGSKKILQLFDGTQKIISKQEAARNKKQFENNDGINTIYNINYNIEGNMVNVYHFDCKYNMTFSNLEIQNLKKNKGKVFI